jgi:hypothetical protein
MTPAEIAKYRALGMSRGSKEIAEKLVSRYVSRLTVLRAKKGKTKEEQRECEVLQDLVVTLC